ncbi:MAG: glycosyltransferase family 4 protein [Candidatus Magasanikbacteria bacterium]|nr:glycosyltransferase family 4 protein [Candidatus Magasanikbacteria bacterium]
MKKTLIITLDFLPNIGGIATYIDQFATHLDPEKTIVLTPDAKGKEIERAYTLKRKVLLSRYIWPKWFRLFFMVKKIIKEEQIEQIHVHHVLPVGYVAWLIKKIYKIPYLVFFHGTDVANASAHKRKKKYARKILLQSKRIIVNSESLKHKVEKAWPETKKKISLVYPCPDVSFLAPVDDLVIEQLKRELSLYGKKVIITISRLVDGKGFPQLISAMAAAMKTRTDLVWIIIGDGNKREEYMQCIKKEQIQSSVRFLSAVPHDQLLPYMKLADVFALLPSSDKEKEEGFGLVFLEAAAAGIPVLAGKSGGVREAVIHGRTGLTVHTNNHTEIVVGLLLLLENTVYAKRLAKNAKLRVSSEFHTKKQIERISKWL